MYKLYRWNKGISKPKFTEQGNLTLCSSPVAIGFVRTVKKGIDYLIIHRKHF